MTEIKDQAGLLLSHIAGYVAHRTIVIGRRSGLFSALADAGDSGATPDQLAVRLSIDPFYALVWCRSALAAGVCERDGEAYRLGPHMASLLLDESSPAFVGGVFGVMEQPELFTRFEASLPTGERLWWDGCSNEFIRAVGGTGRPFYRRLVPGGIDLVPGLADRLRAGGCRILDTACGSGTGLVMLAEAYPDGEIAGVDGDAFSLKVAEENLRSAGLLDRIRLHHSPLEKMTFDDSYALIVNNISLHECRDIDEVARKLYAALEPGGWFVISDFPFPADDAGLRTVPGRVMCGIQFFEAQIDDQLVPQPFYAELLAKHGFNDIGSVQLTPMHALTFARR